MKKRIIFATLSLLSLALLFLPATTQARSFNDLNNQTCSIGGASNSSTCAQLTDPDSSNPLVGPNGLLTKAIRILALVTGIASVIVIVISGIMYVTSGGDSARTGTARKMLIYAIVGVVITAVAVTIVQFFLSRVG